TRALALNPRLLLLDEPAAGMNPDETEQLMRLIGEVRDRFKLTVLVIEHHMDLVMRLCEHIVVLNFGQKLADGLPDAIRGDKRVVEAYLGGGDE
ncbi:MAG: high-affinity branched-chain amino acid ABC transporter ATP-binding protein LivG, partial [Spirochaetae bacterium HGW-Spirochaetae-7]